MFEHSASTSAPNSQLTNHLSLGPVTLNCSHLSQMADFYEQTLGLELLNDTPNTAITDHPPHADANTKSHQLTFGRNQQPLVTMRATPDLPAADDTDAGLYHFAFVFATQADLARTLYQVLQQRPQLFSGSADHLVSEAFYLTDPEGNGIELYFDRNPAQWVWEDQHIKMASQYLDPQAYLQQHLPTTEVTSEFKTSLKLGHFHLKVGEMAAARHFYVDILGFEVTATYPGALFISVGGYHHHFGLNTWESLGAAVRPPTLGLQSLGLRLATTDDLDHLIKRLTDHQLEYQELGPIIQVADPWGNQLLFAATTSF